MSPMFEYLGGRWHRRRSGPESPMLCERLLAGTGPKARLDELMPSTSVCFDCLRELPSIIED